MRPAWCWRKRGVRRDQHEGELSTAMALLGKLPLTGRLVTGDALYCQRDFCTAVVAAGGDYLVTVKENQPALYEAIVELFASPPPGEAFATAATRGQHGDRLELRRLAASAALTAYLGWPGAQQVLRVVRTVRRKGTLTRQVRYSITSLATLAAHGDAASLLRHRRGHWSIENRLHWVRDETFGEDASQIRSGAAPQVMAALRNTVIGLLRLARADNLAAALRTLGWTPGAALYLLGISRG
jgi:predicted transposase YbfD/YdcC